MSKKTLLNEIINFTFLLPALLLFFLIVVYGLFQGAGISLTDWNGYSPTFNYVGFKNFLLILQDPRTILPLKNTFVFTIITTIFVNVCGLMLAIGLNRKFKGVNVLKTLFFMPIIISILLASFIWSYIYSPVLTQLFGIRGLLGSQKTANLGLAIICIWRDSGYAMMIYFAGLQSISRHLYEAAEIDGANAVQKFINITIPMLAPAFTISIICWTGWGLRVFDYAMAATNGGPGRASEPFSMYVYKLLFPYNRTGYGQAAALFMTAGIVVITYIMSKFLRKREIEL